MSLSTASQLFAFNSSVDSDPGFMQKKPQQDYRNRTTVSDPWLSLVGLNVLPLEMARTEYFKEKEQVTL